MAEDFVVIYNLLHQCLAELTRRSLLRHVWNKWEDSSKEERTIEDFVHDTIGIGKIVPARYWELLSIPDIPNYWSNGTAARTGETLHRLYYTFDANRVDPLCRDGLRGRITTRPNSLFSLDLINYGVGVVRRARAWSVGCGPVGKIKPKGYKVYQTILAKTHVNPDDNNKPLMEDWESTNIVFGDMYGEVLQIKDREKDTNFLKKLCEGLNQKPIIYWGEKIISLHQKHIDCQRLWNHPPKSPEELTERVDYIIAHSTLDKNPGISMKYHSKFKDKQYVCALSN